MMSRFFMAGTGFSADQLDQFCVRLQRRLQTNPGIAGVAYADFVPLGTSAGPYRTVEVEGYVAKPGESMDVSRALISSRYFDTMRIPLLDGRDFRESDDKSAPLVMIVNEAFSRRFFRGENPVGHKIRMRGKWATVIGLAKDSKYFNAAESSKPFFYSPIRQSGVGSSGLQIYFLIKTGDEAAPIYAAMRREVAAIDPNAGAFHAMPYTAWSEVTLLPQKIAANFLAALGIISLLLSGVGLYSVMSYAVSQRTQEMGIRMALGAMPGDIVRMVLMKSMALAGAGLLAGALLAIFAARMVGTMLVHVTTSDPATFAAALGFLAAVSLLAGYLPARRATRVDPMTAFRCE